METKFSPAQIANETPQWAKWMFRITFLVTTSLCVYFEATSLISDNAKHELLIVLKLLVDPIVFGISKMFGIDKDENGK